MNAIKPTPQVFEEPVTESKYLEFLFREKYRLYEDAEQNQERLDAINELQQTANQWAIEMAVKKGASKDEESARS